MLKKSLFVTVMLLLALGCTILSANTQSETKWVQATDRYGNTLKIEQNPVTKASHRVYGLRGDISRYGIALSALDQGNIDDVAKRFLVDYQEIIRMEPDDLVLKQANHRMGKWYISYEQIYQGIPVYRTSVGFTIERQGKIPRLGADIYPEIAVSTVPSISAQQARETAGKIFRTEGTENSNLVKDISLLIYPEIVGSEINYHLVYDVELFTEKPRRQWIYFVDAHSGDIVYSTNALRHGNWNIHGTVKEYYYPEHYYDTPIYFRNSEATDVRIYNSLGQQEAQCATNSSGYYNKDWSSAYGWKNLQGKKNTIYNSWVKIEQADQVHNYGFYPSSSKIHNWNWATDETNVYYHADWIHDFYKGSPFNTSIMDYQMKAYVHDGSGVNGWSNGTNIGFGSEDDKQWAKSSDVVYHEYTHCLIYHLYGYSWIGYSPNGQGMAMDEGFPDYFACTINDDNIFGESVLGAPRNIGYDYTLSDWIYNDYHKNGRIIAGACWDMRSYLGTTAGNSLTFDALALSPHADEFSEFLDNVLYEDDDDSDISNRTPHMGHICYSFYLHEIEASDPDCPNPRGDINADGDLDVLDLVILSNIILEEYNPTPYEEWAADVNDDGEINVLDSVKLANMILGIPDPPHDFPEPAFVYLARIPGQTSNYNVMLENSMAVGGIELHIEFNPHTFIPGTPGKTDRSAAFDFAYNILADRIIVLLSSATLEEIAPGMGPIVYLPSESHGGGNIHIAEATLCASDGAGIPIVIRRMGPPKTAFTENQQLPTTYLLSQNYPNPFNPETTIEYALPEATKVRVQVYNSLGQVVEVLVDSEQEAGYHEIKWNGEGVASGVYFYRLTAGEFTDTKRMVLMK